MRTDHGDLWSYPADVRCVTTNGVVKVNGELVMGAGVAKQAAALYPSLAKYLGDQVRRHGNVPFVYGTYASTRGLVCSFPTKEHWQEPSKLSLIAHSAQALVKLTDEWGWQTVVMPPPGCGRGGLTWTMVGPVLKPILDDRFVILLSPGTKT